MTIGQNFMKKGKCKINQCSPMAKLAWCDLDKEGDFLKIHDHCSNPKSKGQKQITFTPEQFQLEGGSIQKKLKSIFRGAQAAWKKVLKTAINATPSFFGMAVSAKTENPKVGQPTTNNLKSISGSKFI